MADEEVTFERVTKVYREESGKRTATKLELDFYRKLVKFLEGLEARAAAEAAKDSTSPAAMMAQDELRKVKKKREQILQYRERKIALLASSKASGAEASTEGLAREELALFEGLVRQMQEARAAAVTAGPLPPSPVPAVPPPPRSPAPAAPPRESARKEPAFERIAVPARTHAKPEARDAVVVHVLEDIPSFAGLDVSYHLRKEDIVSLPRGIAKVLIDRGKARLVAMPPPS